MYRARLKTSPSEKLPFHVTDYWKVSTTNSHGPNARLSVGPEFSGSQAPFKVGHFTKATGFKRFTQISCGSSDVRARSHVADRACKLNDGNILTGPTSLILRIALHDKCVGAGIEMRELPARLAHAHQSASAELARHSTSNT